RYEHTVALTKDGVWRGSAPLLPPEAAARQWQAERQQPSAATIDLALFRRERKGLRHAPSEDLQYLPWVYHENDLVNELLLSFQETWRSIEATLDEIHWYSHPMLAPEGLLDWLASWFDIILAAEWSVERSRTVIVEAIRLFRWRGTGYGLA